MSEDASEWTEIPGDPGWDSYRLRLAAPRWWRPWWTARVDFIGDWITFGDQRVITVRAASCDKAMADAVEALNDYCQWLADAHADLVLGRVPVLWIGSVLFPVAGSTAGRIALKTCVPTPRRPLEDTPGSPVSPFPVLPAPRPSTGGLR